MAEPSYLLDTHVFLGHVANGRKMVLRAENPSGELWRVEWVKREDGYWCFHIGPVGRTEGPLTYEDAFREVTRTQSVIRKMMEREARYAARPKRSDSPTKV